MTRARRRVVRLALMLKVACIEPVFVGCNYREMQAGLEEQWSGLTPSRRKAVRRQALRLISEAQGLENAADQLVPRPLQQTSTGRQTPSEHSLEQIPPSPPEMLRCSVCRTRFGLLKRSFRSKTAARQLCEMQKDPGLVVYACPAGAGWHLGHRPDTRPATAGHPATTPQRREPHRVDSHLAPMLPTPLHKESPMKMQVTLGNPILIASNSAALLLVGCAVGMHWPHTHATAIWLCIAGGVLMAHDTATGFLWFWLTATWAWSVVIQRNNRG
jgi:hypothetical protein